MKIKVNDNAFAGLTQFNGQILSQEFDMKTKEPVTGKSGTLAFKTTDGGRIYLTEDQYEEIS